MAEIRKGKRYSVCWNLRAGLARSGAASGHTLDISASGLLFRSPEFYALGDRIGMEIMFEGDTFLRCIVEITRIQPYSQGQYIYGARFLHFQGSGYELLCNQLLDVRRQEREETYRVRTVPLDTASEPAPTEANA